MNKCREKNIISLLAITKNYDPKLLRRTAIIAIVLSFIGIFGCEHYNQLACWYCGISSTLFVIVDRYWGKNIKR